MGQFWIDYDDYTVNFSGQNLNHIFNSIINGELNGLVFIIICTPKRYADIEEFILPKIKQLIKNSYLILAMGCGNSILAVNNFLNSEVIEGINPHFRNFLLESKLHPVTRFGPCFAINPVTSIIQNGIDYFKQKNINRYPILLLTPNNVDQDDAVDKLFPVLLKEIKINPDYILLVKTIDFDKKIPFNSKDFFTIE